MSGNMSVTFLGTSSGGGPSETRNCSSLVADVVGDGSLWMVDCAEGTLRQFALQPHPKHLKLKQVKKIFITHMHADHVMGVVPLLRNLLFPPLISEESVEGEPSARPPTVELYGPTGLRAFVRTIMNFTLTATADKYVVHELLRENDKVTPCEPTDIMHQSEVAGHDIYSDEDGFWREFTGRRRTFRDIVVDAGPISHRAPCLGFVIRERSPPNRKLVFLGDTSDPSSITPLALSPSLLIHEATDAYIPRSIDPMARRSVETVQEKALARGHSMPNMAGSFAKKVGTERLVLNHIGARFPSPLNNRGVGEIRTAVIQEIERQASDAWGMGGAQAAWDFMHIVIPPPRSSPEDELDARLHNPTHMGYENTRFDGRRGRGHGGWRGRGQHTKRRGFKDNGNRHADGHSHQDKEKRLRQEEEVNSRDTTFRRFNTSTFTFRPQSAK